jgi:hypothetical protein
LAEKVCGRIFVFRKNHAVELKLQERKEDDITQGEKK